MFQGRGMVRSDDNLQEVMSLPDYLPCFKFDMLGKLQFYVSKVEWLTNEK